MPIVRDIPIELELDEVVRAQGIKDFERLKPALRDSVNEVLDSARGGELFDPAVAYETYPVAELTDSHLAVGGSDVVLHGTLFHRAMPNAQEIVVSVCTIGPKLEKQVADCFGRGDSLRGLLLDGIGSAAVGAVASEACRLISQESSGRGLQAGSPIGPGGPRFPISEQWHLFKLVPAGDIGVSLSESGLMVPRKSMSRVIGIGQQMRTWTPAEACDHCTLSRTCPYRARV